MTSPLPGWPELILEAGLVPAAPVAVAGTLILDDPTTGQLDTGKLADFTSFTDITQYAVSISVSRPSTRVQGPLNSYQQGTLSVVLDNSDGRFDPDNASSPYSPRLLPMVPVRLRASIGAVDYYLFNGFADGWQPSQVTYEGGYAELNLNATDGFKILGGQNLATIAPAGGGEKSGARVKRILDSAAWFTDHRQIASGGSPVQATTYGTDALSLLQLTTDTEAGELYVDGSGNVVFRARRAILTDTRSAVPQAVFGDLPSSVNQIPLADSTFETALTGNWIIFANITSLTQSVVQAYDGTHSLAIAFTAAGGSTWIYAPLLEAVSGTPYKLTFAFRPPVVDVNSHVQAFWFTASGAGNGSTNFATNFANDTTGWDVTQATVTPPAGTATVQLWFLYTVAGASTGYIDFVSWQRQTELAYASVTRASDDTQLATDVQITTAGGTLQEATDAAATTKFLFPRIYARTDLIMPDDTSALGYAQWVLTLSKNAENRFSQVTIDPNADPGGLFPQVLGRDTGDRVTIWNRPAGLPLPVVKDCFVRGIAHDIDCIGLKWLTTWTLQDASRYGGFLMLDDPVLGKLDSNKLAY